MSYAIILIGNRVYVSAVYNSVVTNLQAAGMLNPGISQDVLHLAWLRATETAGNLFPSLSA